MFPCGRIDDDRTFDICTAEQTDGLVFHGTYPVRHTLIIDLKIISADHGCRITETDISVQISAEVLKRRNFDTFLQFDQVYILRSHIDGDIGRDACAAVGEPFDQVTVLQGCYTNRFALIVDLIEIGADFVLRNHVYHAAHFSFSQSCRRVAVQNGDLIVIHLMNVAGKIACLHIQQFSVGRCTDNRRGQQHPYTIYDDQYHGKHHQFLYCFQLFFLFYHYTVSFQKQSLENRPEIQHQPNQYCRHKKHPAFFGMDIQRRQIIIIHPRPYKQGQNKQNRTGFFQFSSSVHKKFRNMAVFSSLHLSANCIYYTINPKDCIVTKLTVSLYPNKE